MNLQEEEKTVSCFLPFFFVKSEKTNSRINLFVVIFNAIVENQYSIIISLSSHPPAMFTERMRKTNFSPEHPRSFLTQPFACTNIFQSFISHTAHSWWLMAVILWNHFFAFTFSNLAFFHPLSSTDRLGKKSFAWKVFPPARKPSPSRLILKAWHLHANLLIDAPETTTAEEEWFNSLWMFTDGKW